MHDKYRLTAAVLLMCALLSLSACASDRTEAPEESVQTAGETEADETTEIVGSVEAPAPDGAEEASAGADTEADSEDADTGILVFTDAYGETHEAEIDEAVAKHPYDWSNLSGSGMNLSYKDDVYTTRLGVDVCAFSGSIDWDRVRDAGVTFAIVRIGGRGYGASGALYEDELAMSYLTGARNAGLDVGVYFFSQAVSTEEAVEEADFVLGLLDGMELEMPVFFDPETIDDDEARTDDVSGEQFTENAIAFCNRIREAGYEAMVYCNMLWEAYELDLSALQAAGIEIWYADYEPVPQTPYDFSIWQYAGETYIDGIERDVDLNLQFIH